MNNTEKWDFERLLVEWDLWQPIRGNLSDYGLGRLEDMVLSLLSQERSRLREEVEKLEPPVFLMQDGVSADFAKREGWLEAKETILSTLQDKEQ